MLIHIDTARSLSVSMQAMGEILPLLTLVLVGLIIGLLLGAFGGWGFAQLLARGKNKVEANLAQSSREKINAMLQPFREQIISLTHQVKESSRSQIDLKGQLQQMSAGYQQVSQQAENLTKALKGDPQARGKWGEMLLEKVLESSGLREGEEYHLQKSFTDRDTDRRYRPDAVITLPANREVIVDAKTSLVDYEKYASSQEPSALENFLKSLRSRVKELGEKNYANVSEYSSASGASGATAGGASGARAASGARKVFDYVLMFVPIESAFSLALDKDKGLMDYALERKIVLVSPSTMLLALRTIYYSWRSEKQNRNAEEIAREGGALYDKVAAFIEDMEKHGLQLATTQKSYDGAMKKLASGRGNILSRTERLGELGVKKSKQLQHQSEETEQE